MYGMVNDGIHNFILKHHDADTWQSLCEAAYLETQEFHEMERYDDSVTFQLVHAISDHTGLSAGAVLTEFGSHWIDYAGASPFGALMTSAGNSFLERLRGLDDMHARVQLSMPDLKPPSFKLERKAETTYHLHYISQRTGLDAMVIGMLRGLAEDTGEDIEIKQIAAKSEIVDHSVFEIVLIR
ncbi:heme NO-binding domain-containing protein [Roseobacter sp. A03A-229]